MIVTRFRICIIAKMIFLFLILWVGISEQKLPEETTSSPEVAATSAQLEERTSFSPTTFKIYEESIQTESDVSTKSLKLSEPEVTLKPEVLTEPVPTTKPEVTPSEETKMTGVLIRSARPEYSDRPNTDPTTKQAQPDLSTKSLKLHEPEVTIKHGVIAEKVHKTEPEVTPSEETEMTGVLMKGVRPDYNEDGTANTFGQYIERILILLMSLKFKL